MEGKERKEKKPCCMEVSHLVPGSCTVGGTAEEEKGSSKYSGKLAWSRASDSEEQAD